MTDLSQTEIVDDLQQMPPSAEKDVHAQFSALRNTKDLALRDRFVCEHLHLVYSVARRFSGLGESLEDLIQEGAIGLLNAVDLFDPGRGVKFSTYACHLITGQIQHYLRDRGRLIRQPAWVQELSAKVTRTTEQMAQELGRDPQPDEVANRLNLTEDSLQNVLAARELNHVVSLSAPADGNGDSETSVLDKEKISSEKLATLQLSVEDRIVLEEAINSLKALEQKVVRHYFFEDLNQTEIARKLGISVNYSSYLLRRATGKIKSFLEEQANQGAEPLEPAPREQFLPTDIPTYDQQAGVYSGAYLRTRVMEEMARSQRYPTNFALLLAQLQGLPGEQTEQQPLLWTVGQMLRNSARTVDLVAYAGNGRFSLLLPHTGREAKVLGERLCRQFIMRDLRGAPEGAPLTLNIGFAVFPMDGTDAEMLFARAESALTRALKGGPNMAAGVPTFRLPGTRD